MVQSYIPDEFFISNQYCSCTSVNELVSKADILSIITNVGVFYPKLIKEFIVNLRTDLNNPLTLEFCKIHLDLEPSSGTVLSWSSDG